MDSNKIQKASELMKKYEDLLSAWEKRAKLAKTDDEYSNTRDDFDKAIAAYDIWKEYFFENARDILMHKEDR